jgi:hypothetical protein
MKHHCHLATILLLVATYALCLTTALPVHTSSPHDVSSHGIVAESLDTTIKQAVSNHDLLPSPYTAHPFLKARSGEDNGRSENEIDFDSATTQGEVDKHHKHPASPGTVQNCWWWPGCLHRKRATVGTEAPQSNRDDNGWAYHYPAPSSFFPKRSSEGDAQE